MVRMRWSAVIVLLSALLILTGARALAVSTGSGDQAAQGRALYMFYCSTCHADTGEGLTAAWRAQWNPADQNCWFPKCHGDRYPRDFGFKIPRYVPPVIGPGALSEFGNAQALYGFIASTMPFQDPSLVSSQEHWAIAAYLLEANGIPLGGAELGADNAASIEIPSPTPKPTSTPRATATPPR